MAIKIISQVDEDEEVLRGSLRELMILKNLSKMFDEGAYPHSIRLLGARLFRDEDGLSLALFLECFGKSIDIKLENHSDSLMQNSSDFKRLLYNSVCSLNFIHSAGLMHRDIKPGNLLVGKGQAVKICDFGLSRDYSIAMRKQ